MSPREKTLLVRASRPGLRVPREGQPRQHITDDKPCRVASSPYYRRLLRDGSLVQVEEKPAKKSGGES